MIVCDQGRSSQKALQIRAIGNMQSQDLLRYIAFWTPLRNVGDNGRFFVERCEFLGHILKWHLATEDIESTKLHSGPDTHIWEYVIKRPQNHLDLGVIRSRNPKTHDPTRPQPAATQFEELAAIKIHRARTIDWRSWIDGDNVVLSFVHKKKVSTVVSDCMH